MNKISALVLCLILAGCASGIQCTYEPLTKEVYAPKDLSQKIMFSPTPPPRPYKEIGHIKAQAELHTPLMQLNQEMAKKAKKAGADAVIDLQYSNTDADMSMVEKDFTMSDVKEEARGTAVVFLDKK